MKTKQFFVVLFAIAMIFVFASCQPEVNNGIAEVSFSSGNNSKAISSGDGERIAFEGLTHQIKFISNSGTGYCDLAGAKEGFVSWPTSPVKLGYGNWTVCAQSVDIAGVVVYKNDGVAFTVGNSGLYVDGVKSSNVVITESYCYSAKAKISVSENLRVLTEDDTDINSLDTNSSYRTDYTVKWYTSSLTDISFLNEVDYISGLTGFTYWENPTVAREADGLTYALGVIVDNKNAPGFINGSALVMLEGLSNGRSYTIGSKSSEYLQFGVRSVEFLNNEDMDLFIVTEEGILSVGDKSRIVGHIDIPSEVNGITVKGIGSRAFQGCSDLTEVSIPNSVIYIGDRAFSMCSSLTVISIPESVTSIGENAFYQCTSLANITIPNSVTIISNRLFHSCSSLTSITIPAYVTSIGEKAFYHCTSLANVTIPNSVTIISNRLFHSCSSLTSITIPAYVTSIDELAFFNCNGLTSLSIPVSVTHLGEKAFAFCSNLSDLSFEGSISQWYGVEKDYGWNLEIPATVVHCSDGDAIIGMMDYDNGDEILHDHQWYSVTWSGNDSVIGYELFKCTGCGIYKLNTFSTETEDEIANPLATNGTAIFGDTEKELVNTLNSNGSVNSECIVITSVGDVVLPSSGSVVSNLLWIFDEESETLRTLHCWANIVGSEGIIPFEMAITAPMSSNDGQFLKMNICVAYGAETKEITITRTTDNRESEWGTMLRMITDDLMDPSFEVKDENTVIKSGTEHNTGYGTMNMVSFWSANEKKTYVRSVSTINGSSIVCRYLEPDVKFYAYPINDNVIFNTTLELSVNGVNYNISSFENAASNALSFNYQINNLNEYVDGDSYYNYSMSIRDKDSGGSPNSRISGITEGGFGYVKCDDFVANHEYSFMIWYNLSRDQMQPATNMTELCYAYCPAVVPTSGRGTDIGDITLVKALPLNGSLSGMAEGHSYRVYVSGLLFSGVGADCTDAGQFYYAGLPNDLYTIYVYDTASNNLVKTESLDLTVNGLRDIVIQL